MNRDHALALAQKGLKVFLLKANEKTPLVVDFPNVATNDLGKVASMWTGPFGESRDENIGISTDNLLILDFDAKVGRDIMEREFATYTKIFGLKHAVMTAGGGYHAYMRLPEGVRCAGKVKIEKLGKSIDTRSFHNYVVAPGSSIDHMPYTWLVRDDGSFVEPSSVDDLPFAHPEIIEAHNAPAERKERPTTIELDTPAAISQAMDYLINNAPVARQGEGGDVTTYGVACRVREFGVSSDKALELMSDLWNEAKAVPPWGLEELERKVENAYQYAKGVPHVPGSEFEPVDIAEIIPPRASGWPFPTFTEPYGPEDTQDREWVIPGLAVRKNVVGLIAPSGAGKTQFLIQLMLAVAANRPDIIGFASVKPTTVWLWNQEDDLSELMRRRLAAHIHHEIKWDDLIHRPAMDSGVGKKLLLVDRDKTGKLFETSRVQAMIDAMKAKNIGLLILDPLIGLHRANENDNGEMELVGDSLRRIANETNSAIVVGHHTRKPDGAKSDGFAGNADSSRGASSLIAITRKILTLCEMSEKDAKKVCTEASERHWYVRLDGAKANLSKPTSRDNPLWLKRVGQPLGPGREEIGVLVPVDLAQSRLKKEPVENEPNHKAVVIADSMEKAGLAPEVKHSWADVRDRTAEATGESAKRDGPLGRWPGEIGYDVSIDAGKGRTIEFKKPVSSGNTARVILRCQAIVNSSAAPVAVPSAA